MQASAARALGGGRSAAALADSARRRLRMGRPELPQKRVQLGRASLAAAGYAVVALVLFGVAVVIRRVPVKALAALLLRDFVVDPAHHSPFIILFFVPINSMHNFRGMRCSAAEFNA